ncbi:MAG TPA: flavin reductase family protein [Acidimicrobiales bacterium]|nr:flavin reductase family protein [Acidimicrobiales bacterium]
MVTAAHDPVGPFPPGADPAAYDRLRRRVLWRMPTGLYLLGSRAGSERNLMTLNWATQVATAPKLVAVGVEVSALTHRLVAEGGCFSLCMLGRADRALVRSFVKPAAWDEQASTLNGHAVREAVTGAPVLAGAAAWVDCRVRDRLDLGSHTLFVGEVVDAGEADDPGDDVTVLRMDDTRMNYGG